jgi:hypothetical protein
MSKDRTNRPLDLSKGTYGLTGEHAVPVSFEANELGEYRVYFAERVRVVKITSRLTKAAGAVNAATITAANSAGPMQGGFLSHAGGAAFGNTLVATPTGSKAVVGAGSYLALTTAKAGNQTGKALVTVEFLTLTKREES